MKNISLSRWAEWKRKRRHTFIGFLVVGTVVGIDYSFMFTTLYLYLRDLVKVNKPCVYYGTIICIYSISSSLFGVIFGRLVDRYRKVKLFTNITLILQIIGVTLYIIPRSVVFPIIGRVISGIGDPYVSICSGEIVRIYNQKEATSALWWLSAFYSIGFVIGAVVVIIFQSIDFYIGNVHFNDLNSVGFLIITLLIVVLIVINVLIHDCSAMMDLNMSFRGNNILETNESITKEKLSCNGRINKVSENSSLLNSFSNQRMYYSSNDDSISSQKDKKFQKSEGSILGIDNEDSLSINYSWSVNHSVTDESNIISKSTWETKSIKLVFRGLFTHIDALLMFTSTFIFVYSLFAVHVMLPLLTVVILDWSLTSLSIIFVANGVAYIAMIIVNAKFCVTDRAIYNMLIISIISLNFLFVIMILLQDFKNNETASILLMIIFVIFLASGWVVEEVLIRCTLAKMVPSNFQNFMESLRNGISRLSMVLAAITVPICLPYLKRWCTGIIVANSLLLIAFLLRRKTLLLVREIEIRSNHSALRKRSVTFIRSETLSSTI